jgi:AcrR family transcriptional regulator
VEEGIEDLSVRAVAGKANMSERTVFRYFESRDALLDAVASEVNARQALPPLPRSIDELLDYPEAIFTRFEANQALMKVALRGAVYERIRSSDRATRGKRVLELIDEFAPHVDPARRRLIASNIHYHVIATTWHYYRFRFGFTLEDTIAAARLSVEQAVVSLR